MPGLRPALILAWLFLAVCTLPSCASATKQTRGAGGLGARHGKALEPPPVPPVAPPTASIQPTLPHADRVPPVTRGDDTPLFVPADGRGGSPIRKGQLPTGQCGVRRAKALFRDTAERFAARHHITLAAFNRINGLSLSAQTPLQHKRKYVTAHGGDGERLVGGQPMGASTPHVVVVNPSRAWGQPFVVDLLRRALARVHAQLPGGTRPVLEDISIEHGGCLPPHREHRGGLEVDIGFFHRQQSRHLTHATAANLDARREWLFLRLLLETGSVQMIIVDRKVQALLHREAVRQGVAPALLAKWLQYPRRSRKMRGAVIVHGGGHDNHTHIKFRCPPGGCALPVDLPEVETPQDLPEDTSEPEEPDDSDDDAETSETP